MKGGRRKKLFIWIIFYLIIAILIFVIVEKNTDQKRSKHFKTDTLYWEEKDNKMLFLLNNGILLVEEREKTPAVYAILENSKAEKAGILPGDRLVQVNGCPVAFLEEIYQHVKTEEINEIVFKRKNEYYKRRL